MSLKLPSNASASTHTCVTMISRFLRPPQQKKDLPQLPGRAMQAVLATQMASRKALPPARFSSMVSKRRCSGSAPGVGGCQADQRGEGVQAGLVMRQLRAVLGQAPQHLQAAMGKFATNAPSTTQMILIPLLD